MAVHVTARVGEAATERDDLFEVGVRLARQAGHEVDLHALVAGFEGGADARDHVRFGDALLDRPPQPFAAGFGGDGQAGLPHVAGQLRQLRQLAVCAEAREGN